MRRYLPFVIVATVFVAVASGGTMLYRAKRPTMLTLPSDHKVVGEHGGDADHILGNPEAPVTLEEYGDFECPPCGRLSEPLNQLEKDYRQRVRVVFHHLPLVNHLHAKAAACASEAAALQGRFWPMHDLLYREQTVWSKAVDARPLFNAYAGILGLDVERFKKDIDSEEVKGRVNADQEEAAKLGVTNTPTVFINNRAVPPNQSSPEGLRAAVETAVKEKSSP